MPGSRASGWTIDTVLEHLHTLIASNDAKYGTRFDGITAATNAAMQSAERAVLKAESAAEKRFESLNEFRGTLSDQQRNLMPRAEVDVIVRGLTDKIQAVEKQMDNLAAERQGVRGGWGYAVGVIGVVLAIVTFVAMVVQMTR